MNQNIEACEFFIKFIFIIISTFNLNCYLHNAAEAAVLGFQHYILTLGMTVLIPTIIVPQMGGGDVSTCYIFLLRFFGSNFPF